MTSAPAKSDIESIFHRLRSNAANKTCFDCNAKNPTWATVTYGVFICIDCSAVHRSLGVHLTFVRSTNLDTNWTWPQIRQMQLGGNANAAQFFRQHNCNTTDAQQKYNSRTAQLYKDKLAAAAQQAMKVYGTAVFIDGTPIAEEKKPEEVDFFAECANDNQADGFLGGSKPVLTNNNGIPATVTTSLVESVNTVAPKIDVPSSTGAPSTEFLNYSEPVEIKSSIGVRKIQSKRGLATAKKGGLGATKVKTNFADLEQRANMADQQKFTIPDAKPQSREEELETIASVRLAYQDLSIKAKKEEEKLKPIDPAKAKQMERLGMGFNVRSGVSHSALTDMTTINQTAAPSKYSSVITSPSSTNESSFYDEYLSNSDNSRIYTSKIDRELDTMGFELIEPANSKVSSMFSPSPDAKSPPGYSSINDQPTSTGTGKGSSASNNKHQTPGGTNYTTYEADDAQKKFGAAKAISSDQFFNKEATSFERSANMAKFQGSSSISSADYFGDGPNTGGGRGSGGSRNNYAGPDLEDVRESVRHGVTKVAGRLSSMANDMMSSLQDKYGG